MTRAGAFDLRGVVVRVARVDLQPLLDAVRAVLRVRAHPGPVRRLQTIQKFRRRLARVAEHLERRVDRPVVVEPPGEFLLVVRVDHRLILGEQPAEPSLQAVDIDVLGADEPEPIADGRIDLGEAVVQQLAIALDPYPRAPGAELPAQYSAEEANGSRDDAVTPFAALGRLRKRD